MVGGAAPLVVGRAMPLVVAGFTGKDAEAEGTLRLGKIVEERLDSGNIVMVNGKV